LGGKHSKVQFCRLRDMFCFTMLRIRGGHAHTRLQDIFPEYCR
jgi:hypothetical protein